MHTEHVDTTQEGWLRTGMRLLCPAQLLPPPVPGALGSAWLELCPCGIPQSGTTASEGGLRGDKLTANPLSPGLTPSMALDKRVRRF